MTFFAVFVLLSHQEVHLTPSDSHFLMDTQSHGVLQRFESQLDEKVQIDRFLLFGSVCCDPCSFASRGRIDA